MKNRQRCHHCVVCLAVGVRPLNVSPKRPLGGLRGHSSHSMPGRARQWLRLSLHQKRVGA